MMTSSKSWDTMAEQWHQAQQHQNKHGRCDLVAIAEFHLKCPFLQLQVLVVHVLYKYLLYKYNNNF